ncbi:hypothetical protein, partial [Pseudomonas sp. SWRI 103]|uniref:hypothetical protein n=1 Tax=Pseudomonas sp. SWRI 103 TaxID=2725411 RepID=UPI001C499A30
AVCSERACPALGGEAAPNQATWFYLELRGVFHWRCFAAQRGASPLTTHRLREQARSHIGYSSVIKLAFSPSGLPFDPICRYTRRLSKVRQRVLPAMEINPILNTIKDLSERSETIRGYL